MNDTRAAYLAAAATAVDLLDDPRVGAAWDDPSVLSGMSVGSLAAHLARSVLQVGWFLDGDVTGRSIPVSAVTYYARLTDSGSRSSPLNAGVEARSAETASIGAIAIASQARGAFVELGRRLPVEPPERRVAVAHRPGEELLLDEYLRTRLVELAVHIEDLALSIGSPVVAPPEAVALAVELLFAAARERHGDMAVLHALSRRERDDREALRVL